jgi:hypothetical protein
MRIAPGEGRTGGGAAGWKVNVRWRKRIYYLATVTILAMTVPLYLA